MSKIITSLRRNLSYSPGVSLTFVMLSIWTFLATAQTPRHVEPTTVAVPTAVELKRLSARSLELPKVRAGEPCPVSKGSRQIVPHVSYIFCSECLYFGAGPVYFGLFFLTDPGQDVAAVNLDGVFYREGGVFSMKTPWVTIPDYSGPILVRGQRLDGEGKLEGPELEAPSPKLHKSDWSFWPGAISVTGPGCYGIQIDTDRGTDVVVVKATGGDKPYRSN